MLLPRERLVVAAVRTAAARAHVRPAKRTTTRRRRFNFLCSHHLDITARVRPQYHTHSIHTAARRTDDVFRVHFFALKFSQRTHEHTTTNTHKFTHTQTHSHIYLHARSYRARSSILHVRHSTSLETRKNPSRNKETPAETPLDLASPAQLTGN